MLCDACKAKVPVLFVTKVVNNDVTKIKLCEACAKSSEFGVSVEDSASMQRLLSELLSLSTDTQPGPDATKGDMDEAICPACGLSRRRFGAHRRLGCERCYATFENEVSQAVRETQNRPEHCGKVARSALEDVRRAREIDALRQSLHTAVREEKFEEAAAIRDAIARLEEQAGERKNQTPPTPC